MKTKILALALAVFALFALVSCGSGNDEDNNTLSSLYSQGLDYKVSESNPNQCVITGVGTCTDKDIRIPPSIDGKTVVGIEDSAFASKTFAPRSIGKASTRSNSIETGNSSTLGGVYAPAIKDEAGISTDEIESVTLPLTVKEIGDEAFFGCSSLDTINTTQNISAIGKDAFKDTAYYNNEQNWEGQALYLQNCLISVSPDFQGEFTVKEGTILVADQAFYQCTFVTTVNIAESVTNVGNFAFYGCASLTYVNGADEITFGNSVFEGCFSYEQFIPGGGNTVTPEKPSEGSTGFDIIDEQIFESVKKNPPTSFTANLTITAPNEPTINIDYIVKDYGFYYTVECAGEIITELYGMTEEGNTAIYLRKDGKWYNTTATQPDFSDYQIPEELDFSMLTLYDEKSTVYAYEHENGRYELGIKNNKTAYFGIFIEDTQIKTIYSYQDASVLPDFSNADLIEGIVLDQNGDVVQSEG